MSTIKNFGIFKLFAIVLFFSMSNQTFAQLSFGVRTGINRIELRWGERQSQDSDMQFGFQIGATANYAINSRFSVEPEVLFIKSAALNSLDLQVDLFTGEPVKSALIKIPNNYVQFPIRARYKITNKLTVQAGVHFGFEFGGTCEVTTFNNETEITTFHKPKEFHEQHKRHTNDEYKPFDWGFGAGIARQFGKNIQIGVDFSRRVNSPKAAFLIPARVGNVSLTATYMFGKRKQIYLQY